MLLISQLNKLSSMPHIVSPLRSNLLLQMLLEGNLYIAVFWAASYIVYLVIYEWRHLGLPVLLVLSLATIDEGVRLYVGYTLNLGANGPHPRWLLLSTISLAGPLQLALWYLRRVVNEETLWLQNICNLWMLLIALEVVVAVEAIWSQRGQQDKLPDWSEIEANLRVRVRDCRQRRR